MRIIVLSLLTIFSLSILTAQNTVDENGKKQGEWEKKYPNGKIRYKGQFKDDLEVGTFDFFDKRGKWVSKREFEIPGKKAF